MTSMTQDDERLARPPGTARAADVNSQLFQLTRTMHVLKTHEAAGDGVPWSTYLLLFHLVAGGPRRARALAEAAGTDPSTVSRQVDWLVGRGLVERRADPSDGRATLLVATEAGVATQRRMRAGRDRMMAGVLARWPEDDVLRLTQLLGRLNADLTAQLPQILTALQHRTGLQARHLDTEPAPVAVAVDEPADAESKDRR